MVRARLDQLIDRFEPILRQAFLQSVYLLRDQAQIDQIVSMLEAGNIDGALRAVGLDPASFRALDKQISEAFETSGQATASSVPVQRDAEGYALQFQFNIRNPVAEQWLANNSSYLIREILDDQRTMIQGVLERAMAQGLNPRTTALDLVGRINPQTGNREGGLIGLTSTQEQWLQNYADELSSDNPLDALTRELRDKRFDAAVQKYADLGEPIPDDLMAKMLASYKNRALLLRADSIARTETIKSLHEAQNIALDQAVNSGALKAGQLTMVWRATHDARTRDAHRLLDGQTIKRGGAFQSVLGPIQYPGDPNAQPANVIGCRCWLEPDYDFLAGVN